MKNLIVTALTVLPKLKSFIYADGKFSKPRAIILIITLFGLILAIEFFGLETVMNSINLLDEVSDIYGYE